ncbi:hypothetical protein [Argonema antarcticum]|uniref:hypothetical protein n=1 Tax=Argonema antarcticum TaxID=2942763 RepID=UPI00201197E1|nr:hypothetical protein [Argonema antarcticum]MCL1469977.1 hypothetical protein [Argonema antarcticum A004/B2]
MRKNKNILIAAIALMALASLRLSGAGIAQSPQPTVKLTTEPPVGQLLPFEAEATTPQLPVRLTLQALNAAGKPLKAAKIHLTILTPPKNPWFSTDFPIVEGTKLLDIETIAPSGKVQVEQILPIRGKYQLLVNVTPIVANQFKPIQQTLTLSVPENPVKWRNFGILVTILLLVGLGGGWIIGGKQKIQPGEIAPERVRLLLSGATVIAIVTLLFVNISAELAESQPHEHHSHEDSHPTENAAITDSSGIKLELTGDNNATVGQLANFKVQAIDTKTNKPASNLTFKIKTIPLEDNWVAFAYTGTTDAKGKFEWNHQFFDGAPHQVEVEFTDKNRASNEFLPLQLKRSIAVQGIAPPLSVRLIALAYFTGIIGIGLVLGLGLRQRTAERFQ